MRKLGFLSMLLGISLMQSCRTTDVQNSEEKGLFDRKLATCHVVELDRPVLESARDSIKLEELKGNSKATVSNTVQVIKPLRGPMRMTLGGSELFNAGVFKIKDASATAYGVESRDRLISYLLVISEDKIASLGFFEQKDISFGGDPRNFTKMFAKLTCK